jgi:hypothetical protein
MCYPPSPWIAVVLLSIGAGCATSRVLQDDDMRDPRALVGTTVSIPTSQGRTELVTVTRVEGNVIFGHRPWDAASSVRGAGEIRFEVVGGLARVVEETAPAPIDAARASEQPAAAPVPAVDPHPRRFRVLLGGGGGSAGAANVTVGAGVTIAAAGSVAVSLNGIIGVDTTGEPLDVAELVGVGRRYRTADVTARFFTAEVEVAHRWRRLEGWGSLGAFWGSATAEVTYDSCEFVPLPVPQCVASGGVDEGSAWTDATGGLAVGAGVRAHVAGAIFAALEVRHQFEARARFDDLPADTRVGGTSVALGIGFGLGAPVAPRPVSR